MKITHALFEPIACRRFTITFESNGFKTNICIWNPLNLSGNDYNFDNQLIPNKEWENMYNAILNNEKYRLDINQNKTYLMIYCDGESVQFSSIPDESDYNMIDIVLSLAEYKDDLLNVLKSLLYALTLFPERQDSEIAKITH